MNFEQKLQLNQMIQTNNVEDQTPLIRELKHSGILRNNINAMVAIKQLYFADNNERETEYISQCNFLFTYYTDLFNKIKNDELDLTIMFKALDVLLKIENEEIDQHEGAFIFGTLLKEMYVDSALKKADKVNAEHEEAEQVKGLTWKDYKKSQLKSVCAVCNQYAKLMCGRCAVYYYCCKEHQIEHWKTHKKQCTPLVEQKKK